MLPPQSGPQASHDILQVLTKRDAKDGVAARVGEGTAAAAAATTACRRPRQHVPSPHQPDLQEWVANHRMFVATLEELAGQLAALQPPSKERAAASQQQPSALLQRLLDRAPSEQLAAYASGTLPAKDHLQRSLPEALDANLRLLGVLAAEMRRFVGQVEAAADAAAAAALAGGVDDGSGSSSSAERGAETALLMAGALVGVSRETELVVSGVGWGGGASRWIVRHMHVSPGRRVLL